MTDVFVIKRRGIAALAFAALAGLPLVAAHAAPPRNAPLLAELPAAVSSGQVHALHALDAAQQLKLAINLTLNNQAQLTQFLHDLQDPQSPSYHQYLSVDEFTAQYAPSQADYDAVVAWANAQGLSVSTTRNRHIVDVQGSVDAINRALNVTMSVYQHPTERRQFFAPDRQPTLALAVPVLQITGLDNYTLPQHRLHRGSPEQIARAKLGSVGSGPSGTFLPSDIRTAYYGAGPLTGAGQTIGVFSFDGLLLDDVDIYYQQTGMTSNVPVNTVLVNQYDGRCAGGALGCDDGEQVLDIVNAIGMAPGITQVLFYEGDSGPDILNAMATDNIAKVLSCSWGSTDMGTVNDPIFAEFQAQGQTFLNATGDNGAYDNATWLPPSLNPQTLQIGGTHLNTTGAGGPWASEIGWQDSGGGFYAPAGYAIPTYQQAPGVINGTNAGSNSLRNDPDVSAEGDFDNPVVSNGQLQLGFGGTSFAAPRWAGFIALANEQAQARGGATLGFANPAIYTLATGPGYASDFHDVTSGSNPASDGGPTFFAATGYDLVTGWGSPNGANLINGLSGAPASGFVLSAYPTTPSLTQASTAPVTINVIDENGFSGAVTLSASGLPASVTASFSPATTSSTSTLTLTSTAAAAVGKLTPVTITGTSGALSRSVSVNVFVGNAPHASVSPAALTLSTVAKGVADQTLLVSNGSNSIPLNYAVTTSVDGTCSGATVPWLGTQISSKTVAGGQGGGVDVSANPTASSLAVGTYTAFVCVTSNDTHASTIAVPLTLDVTPGPALETIFESGFESGENNGTTVATLPINQPVDDSIAGSSLDFALGWYHGYSTALVDNINLYDDNGGLSVYWYNDIVGNGVGGVVDAGGTNYALLHSGQTIGPSSTFKNTIVHLNNWFAGADGYIGVKFINSQTSQTNYGYVHIRTQGPVGFPAQVLDMAFDGTGAAIKIP